MDRRAIFSLRTRLRMALAAALPDVQREHPDAQVLFDLATPPAAEERAMLALVDGLRLGAAEHASLSLCLWVEFDARVAAALSLLQGNAARAGPNRPTLGLLADLASIFPNVGEIRHTRCKGR